MIRGCLAQYFYSMNGGIQWLLPNNLHSPYALHYRRKKKLQCGFQPLKTTRIGHGSVFHNHFFENHEYMPSGDARHLSFYIFCEKGYQL